MLETINLFLPRDKIPVVTGTVPVATGNLCWRLIFLCGLLRGFYLTKSVPQAKILRFQSGTKDDFTLQNERRRRKFLRFQSGTKGDFTLQNERRRRKFCGFRAVLRAILRYKMSAADENFAVSERY